MTLEVAALHSADFNQLGGCPAFGRNGLAARATKAQSLTDRGTDPLPRLVHRPSLCLHLGQLRYMDVYEGGFVALEHDPESVLAHGWLSTAT